MQPEATSRIFTVNMLTAALQSVTPPSPPPSVSQTGGTSYLSGASQEGPMATQPAQTCLGDRVCAMCRTKTNAALEQADCGHFYHSPCLEVLSVSNNYCRVSGCYQKAAHKVPESLKPVSVPSLAQGSPEQTMGWGEAINRAHSERGGRNVQVQEYSQSRLRQAVSDQTGFRCGENSEPVFIETGGPSHLEYHRQAALNAHGVTRTQMPTNKKTLNLVSTEGAEQVWLDMMGHAPNMPGVVFALDSVFPDFKKELELMVRDLPKDKALFCAFGKPHYYSEEGRSSFAMFYREKRTGRLLLITSTEKPDKDNSRARVFTAEDEKGLIKHLEFLTILTNSSNALLIAPWNNNYPDQDLYSWVRDYPVKDLDPIPMLKKSYQVTNAMAEFMGLTETVFTPEAMEILTSEFPDTNSMTRYMVIRNGQLEKVGYNADNFRDVYVPELSGEACKAPASDQRRMQAEAYRQAAIDTVLDLAETGSIVNFRMNALSTPEFGKATEEVAYLTKQYDTYYMSYADGRSIPLLNTPNRESMKDFLKFLMDSAQTSLVQYRSYTIR